MTGTESGLPPYATESQLLSEAQRELDLMRPVVESALKFVELFGVTQYDLDQRRRGEYLPRLSRERMLLLESAVKDYREAAGV
jgi:hypothetical protein